MNQNDGYSNNRRRNQKRNERSRNERSSRVERKNIKEERSSKSERQSRGRERDRDFRDKKKSRDVSLKNQRNNQQREFQTEIQKILQKEYIENEIAIKQFRSNVKICEICGQPISAVDIESAISNKNTENPAHFDCVLKLISEEEKPGQNERLTYIGQGKFAVLHFENPNDLRRFTIRRTIEWEKREERIEWRDEISSLFSQVK